MPTEPELLQAVLKNPDEDAPRLEYAKWCERQDDQPTRDRAEFIRIQLDLARRPSTERSFESRQLLERTFALERLYRSVWTRPLGAAPRAVAFFRGFVECVDLEATEFMRLRPELERAAPVRHIDTSGSRHALAALLSSSLLGGLRSLKVDGSALDDAAVDLLAKNPVASSIRWLSLANNLLGIEAARALALSPFLQNLRFVNLLGNPVDPVEQFSIDDETITGTWLPPEGALLESQHGVIPWLHRAARTVWELVPDRFRLV